MILINKGTSNTVILTLSEKTTITNPYYLFVFTSDEKNTVKKLIPTDISINKIRYNEFVIVEPSHVSLTAGTWKYEIYEQASSTNTNITGLNLVENGRVDVVGSSTDVPQFDYNKPNIKVFNG
jgi:hypothetical protein